MLIEELLGEKLGNLSQLKAGALLPALMSEIGVQGDKKVKGDKRSIEQKLDDLRSYNYYNNVKNVDKLTGTIGNKSKITDLGSIKNFAEIKKTQEDDVAGFALYLNDKIVFLVLPVDLSRRTINMKAAWYPNIFDESASSEAKIGEVNATVMKAMIDGLIKANPKGAVTAKIISTDIDRVKSRYQKYSEYNDEEFSGKKALTARLAKYKLSKNPTAKDIEEFFTMALAGKNSKIRLDDKTYEIQAGYDTVKTNASNAAIFRGKPFKIKYSAINAPGDYSGGTVIITMKFSPETMTIAPISIENSSNLKAKAFNKDEYIRDKLDIKGAISKETIIKKLLTLVKDNKLNDAKNGLKFVRNAEYDWPELDRIERAIADKKED